MSPSVESSRKRYPCGIGDCRQVESVDRDLATHLRIFHGHGINFFWKCPHGGPKCDTTKVWRYKGTFVDHLRRIHGIEPDNDYISRCIDSPDRRSPPPLLADPGPVKKPPAKKPPVKKSPPKKPPLKRLLPKEVQLQEKPLQEEPAQEHVHQGLPAGQQELQESVQDRMFNTPQAGPSQKRVRTQGPALQNLMHRVEPPPQGLLPRAPAISNAAHARPSPNPLPWEPLREESPQEQFCNRMQAEHAAMSMSSPASTPSTAEVTRAGESQEVLLQDEDWEAFFQESGPLATSLPEGLHTGLPLEVLFGETELERVQSEEQPPPEPPARWGTMPESSTASTITSSTADGQHVAAHNQTEDDHISPDSAESSIYDPQKPGRHQRQG